MQHLKSWFQWIFALLLASLQARALLHQVEIDERPTCEELRSFWDVISNSVRLSQLTNEIPIIPLQLIKDLQHQNMLKASKNLRGKWGHFPRQNLQNANVDFMQPFMNVDNQRPYSLEPITFLPHQENPDYPISNELLSGFYDEKTEFEDNPLVNEMSPWPRETSFSPSSKSNGEEAYVPKYGSIEDVGKFGPFLGIDERSFSPLPVRRIPKEPKGKWTAFPEFESSKTQAICSEVMKKPCSADTECSCEASTHYKCIRGRCTNESSENGYNRSYEIWHDGPLPRPKLGLFARIRKSRSIFM